MARIIKNTDAKRTRCPECKSTIEFDVSDVKVNDENLTDAFIICPVKTCKNKINIIIPERWKNTIQLELMK